MRLLGVRLSILPPCAEDAMFPHHLKMFQFVLSLFSSIGSYVFISADTFQDMDIGDITPISMVATETYVAVVSNSGELYYVSKA